MMIAPALTPAKRRALRQLHRRRRGVRIHQLGLPPRRYQALLNAIRLLVQEPDHSGRSKRALARECGVHESTVRRWLRGIDHPPAAAVRQLSAWRQRTASSFPPPK